MKHLVDLVQWVMLGAVLWALYQMAAIAFPL